MKQLSLAILSTIVIITVFMQPVKAQNIQLSLEPHASKFIENTHMFSLDAKCTVYSSKKTNTIQLHVIKNTGSINGKQLSKGQSTSVTVNTQEAVSVHAEPGSQVNISNLSQHAIQASCSI